MNTVTKLVLSIPAVLFGVSLLAVEDAKPSYFYLEASPTYMTSKMDYSESFYSHDGNLTVKRNYAGASIAFGWQINKWHSLQVAAGYVSSSTLKVDYVDTNRWTGVPASGTLKYPFSKKSIPVLLNYNFTVPVWRVVSFQVGPTVGFARSTYQNWSGCPTSATPFAYGLNTALKFDITKRIFTKVAYRYLRLKSDSDLTSYNDSSVTSTVNNISVTLGWNL